MPGIQEESHQGRLVHIEVENFKSYRGHHLIGPFYEFTAVIGANGSGKSNLMDAICFVLGVKAAQLRGSLKELLYSNSDGTSEQDRPRRGHVKLVFETSKGEEIQFQRSIVPSGASADASFASQYRISDRTVSWEAYNNKLKGFGIRVEARNSLVFQVCLAHITSPIWPFLHSHVQAESEAIVRARRNLSTCYLSVKVKFLSERYIQMMCAAV